MTLRILVSLLTLLGVAPLAFSQYAVDVGTTSGLPGESVSVPITIDNPMPAQGFQLGLSHDDTLLTPMSIEQSALLLASNAGDGADYFTFDLAPIGGSGVVVGSIVSLSPPFEAIPAGTGNEVATVVYEIAPTAPPGASSALSPTASLGNPPIAVVISVDGVSQVPSIGIGQIDVETPPVSGVACALIDPCTCAADLTWTNGFAYDAVEITQDGVTIAMLPGNATQHTVTLPSGGPVDLCVIGVSSAIGSDPVCCTTECPAIPPAQAPTGLACIVDHGLCEVAITWTNGEPDYAALEVRVDGVFDQALPGTETTAFVTLSAPLTPTTIAIVATDGCGAVLAEVSCVAECIPEQFVRGDANGDGGLDISDPIAGLGYLFAGAATDCLDALDGNDSGGIDISDAVYVLGYIFAGGPPPQSPFPACGPDATDTDTLDCTTYTCP